MIIVSPYQISDDTAEAGAAKPNSHTRIRRGSVLTSTEQDGEVLDSSLRPQFLTGAEPDNITRCGWLVLKKVVCFCRENAIYDKKCAEVNNLLRA